MNVNATLAHRFEPPQCDAPAELHLVSASIRAECLTFRKALPPTLKFPVRPSRQRANGGRQLSHTQAKMRPSCSGSNRHDAGTATTFPTPVIHSARGVVVAPAEQDAAQRSMIWNPLTKPAPKTSRRVAPRFLILFCPTSQGSQDATVNSGPGTPGESWHAATSSVST